MRSAYLELADHLESANWPHKRMGWRVQDLLRQDGPRDARLGGNLPAARPLSGLARPGGTPPRNRDDARDDRGSDRRSSGATRPMKTEALGGGRARDSEPNADVRATLLRSRFDESPRFTDLPAARLVRLPGRVRHEGLVDLGRRWSLHSLGLDYAIFGATAARRRGLGLGPLLRHARAHPGVRRLAAARAPANRHAVLRRQPLSGSRRTPLLRHQSPRSSRRVRGVDRAQSPPVRGDRPPAWCAAPSAGARS